MALTLDPEYLKALEPHLPLLEKAPKHPVGEVLKRRETVDGTFDLFMPAWPDISDVEQFTTVIKSKDGAFDINLTHFTKAGTQTTAPGPVVYYAHGGGYFSLSVKHYQKMLELYVSRSGVPIIAVDYRLAPEHPFPVPIDDCYTALEYISKNAKDFNVDPSRITIYGDSAGGGLAAGIAIKARDEGLNPPLAKQMIVGGMLDDRKTATRNDALTPFLTWTHDDNLTGWAAYLGDAKEMGSKDVSPYAAPSRVESVVGLPPLYLEVPGFDVFRDENLDYARRIAGENIDTEVHVWKSLPHSFEIFAPYIKTAEVALMCRVRAMQNF